MKDRTICKTTNLYVAAYLNFLHLYSGVPKIRMLDIVDDNDFKFGNGKPKKAFRFEVDSEVKIKEDGRDVILDGEEYFNHLVDKYYNGDFKYFVDSLKTVIPMLNSAIKKERDN